ncbi:MAG: ATP-binding protein, partial [Bacteroidales bacterium]
KADDANRMIKLMDEARSQEKNFLLRNDEDDADLTLKLVSDLIEQAKTTRNRFGDRQNQAMADAIITAAQQYKDQFVNVIKLVKEQQRISIQMDSRKQAALEEMIKQGRDVEELSDQIRADQKKELQQLEKVAMSAVDQMRDKRVKADDANRMIKLMDEARQEEKNFLLRKNENDANLTLMLVNDLIAQAKITHNRFDDPQNQAMAKAIISASEKYIAEFKDVIELEGNQREGSILMNQKIQLALDEMVRQGRDVEELSDQIRADQKKELLLLEESSRPDITEMRDKRVKADDANRMIKLMDEARSQEKNFLLRNDEDDADLTLKLVSDLIEQAKTTRNRFGDRQNQAMADAIITAAQQYKDQFVNVIKLVKEQQRISIQMDSRKQAALEEMIKQGRDVEELSDQIRADQKNELQQLEKAATSAIDEMNDKRMKADDANRMIKLMDEARSQEKNFLLRQNTEDAELTLELVDSLIAQAYITKKRFNDLQNQTMAQTIVAASEKYTEEFRNVIEIVNKQHSAAELMIAKAREVEKTAQKVEKIQDMAMNTSVITARLVSAFAEIFKIIILILLAWVLMRVISDPVLKLSNIMSNLSKDDTNVNIPEQERGDEIGVMGKAIQILKERVIERNRFQKEIIMARDEAERTNLELKTVNEELEAFAYSVSHDLRAPLRAINGFTRIILKKYEDTMDEEGKRQANVIMENALKMSQLIDDLLGFSRLGRKSMNFSRIDMKKMANDIISELKKENKGRNISFTVADLPTINADSQLLHQVWLNLVSNAFKFTSHLKKAEISIGYQENKKKPTFFIKDNGAGFDMQYADKLFGVFQRLHSDKEFQGTGVGLALVQRIVHRHGGKVWAEGEVGKGATFYFSMPK